jgi:hypothetical protein
MIDRAIGPLLSERARSNSGQTGVQPIQRCFGGSVRVVSLWRRFGDHIHKRLRPPGSVQSRFSQVEGVLKSLIVPR